MLLHDAEQTPRRTFQQLTFLVGHPAITSNIECRFMGSAGISDRREQHFQSCGLIADGKIRLIQTSDIRQFVSDGLLLSDGSKSRADLVVLATGYKGQDHIVGSLFGPEVAARVGPIWGFDANSQEQRNMWTRAGQPRAVVHRRFVLAMPDLFAVHRAADRRDRGRPPGEGCIAFSSEVVIGSRKENASKQIA
jgi:hypothetical protein